MCKNCNASLKLITVYYYCTYVLRFMLLLIMAALAIMTWFFTRFCFAFSTPATFDQLGVSETTQAPYSAFKTHCVNRDDIQHEILCQYMRLSKDTGTEELSLLLISQISFLFRLQHSSIEYDFVSIPSCMITKVTLFNITYFNQSSQNDRLPFNQLLVNVKAQATMLTINSSDVRSLNKLDFEGFTVLEHLALIDCQISAVEVDTFQSLIFPVQINRSVMASRLVSLNLDRNNLLHFDWSVLQPIKQTLTEVSLRKNDLERLIPGAFDSTMFFPVLGSILLSFNNLSGIPEKILKTLKTYPQFEFDYNLFVCDGCLFEPVVRMVQESVASSRNISALGRCVFRNGTMLQYSIISTGVDKRTLWHDQNIPPSMFNHCRSPTTGLPFLSNTSQDDASGGTSTDVVVGVTSAVVITACFLLAILLALSKKGFFRRKIRRSTETHGNNNYNANRSFKLDSAEREKALNGADVTTYLVPRTRIFVDRGAILGVGNFGKVFLGELFSNTNGALVTTPDTVQRQTVAIKEWKNQQSDRFYEEFYTEVKTMMKLGKHPNIVGLMGVHQEEEMLLLLEFCAKGSLDKLLTGSRNTFAPKRVENNYVETGTEHRQEVIVLGETQLVIFCHQICRGMAHISSMGIIHRDLAARNILVDDHMIAKIADFGMAREDSEYFLQREKVALPVKWMAPESIKSRAFSTKSDVWSFGIVIWEIFTLGDCPYAGFAPHGLWERLQRGYRLCRPNEIPDKMNIMMNRCWEWMPEQRPSFEKILCEAEHVAVITQTEIQEEIR